jgi:hypothetical protein
VSRPLPLSLSLSHQTRGSEKLTPRNVNSTFNQQSPNNVQVGTQADLSDLTIKSEKEDFAAEA